MPGSTHDASPQHPAANAPRPAAIEYRGVSYTYRAPSGRPGEKPALQNVSLDVREGERLGILGPNGGGKSTLLKLTLGLLDAQAGSIRVLGMSPDAARKKHLIGYVPQRNLAELRFPLSVRQVVTMGASLGVPAWRSLPRERRERVGEALAALGIESIAERPIGELSGGQLQRAMVARAIAANPRILVLDEPTVGVDPAGQQQFAEMLVKLHARFALTMVIVSHDLRTIAAGCDRIACLSCTLHSHVAPEGLTPAVLAEVFRHDVAAIFGDVHVDAHSASECDHGHAHVHTHVPVVPRISAPAKPGASTTPQTNR